MIQRTLESIVSKKLNSGKAVLVTGARQVGKTTLIKTLLEGKDFLFLDADDPVVRKLLESPSTEQLRSIIGNYQYVFLDEAQRIKGIGLTLKIITDRFKSVQLIVSGSSSFYLANELNEPLTGRKWEFEMFPVSWEEYESKVGFIRADQDLENRLLYGFYPDVINHPGEEKMILKNLVNSYLYKDLLEQADLRKPELIEKLLQALALQTASEINYNELAQLLGVNKITIQHYIDLLERGYVIFRLPAFSRNIRNEINRNRKIYFYDLGVRNMIIGNFSPLDLRQDKGALWENFLISERLKQNIYKDTFSKIYFWRTKQQQELDFVEENEGKVKGFEFKWQTGKVHLPKNFMETYQTDIQVIGRNSFRDFVVIKS